MLKYGLLDDEHKVVRWVLDKPSHSDYVVKKVKQQKRKSAYEIAAKNSEESPF